MKRIFLLHILAALAVAVAACPAACALAHEEGDTVLFGRWEQDGDPSNGPEPIEWIVAEQQDGASVLISSCTLDVRPFHGKAANVTWETSSLRAWLNGEFFRKAFSESEKESMIAASVAAERNPLGGGNPGNSTQ